MRYWFDVHNGNGFTPDEEGQIAPNADAARQIALVSIRSIVSAEVDAGTLDLRGKIDVRCEEGDIIFTVAFIDAFELRLPSEGP